MTGKNIAFVIHDIYGYAGTENVANFMSECLGKKNQITIYSLSGSGKPFYPFENVKDIVNLSDVSFKMFRLICMLKKNRHDIVFVISMGKLSVIYSFFCLLLGYGQKSIACEHIALNSFSKHIQYLKYFFLKRMKYVVVLTKKDMATYNSKNINAIHIPNPVNYKGFIRNNKRNNIILAVGRLEHQKGFDRMLSIWADFKKHDQKSKLVIAGDGSQKEFLINLAEKLHIDDSVNFVGRINNIDDMYKSTDLLLMTSYYEGMPLALLEAKSWSMPVIAYDCPTGPKEIINDSVDGFLVKDNDSKDFVNKLLMLSNDDELYYRMSESTCLTSQNFSVEEIKTLWQSLV